MIEFSKWAENHNINSLRSQVASDRSDLGVVGFEGLQDIVDALKLVARSNPTVARGLVSGLAGKLTVLIRDEDPALSQRLRAGAGRFVAASSKLGE